MDRDQLNFGRRRARRSEGGFAFILTTMIIAIGILTIAAFAIRNSNNVLNASRTNVENSELNAKMKLQRDASKRDVVTASAGNVTAFVAGTIPLTTQSGTQPGNSRNDLQNTVASDQLAGVSRSIGNVTNTRANSSAYQSVPVPTGLRSVFGGSANFIGRRYDVNYSATGNVTDAITRRLVSATSSDQVQIYEFPANIFSAMGNKVVISNGAVSGNVLAGWLSFSGNGSVTGSATVIDRLSTAAGNGTARVAGRTLNGGIDAQAGPGLAKDLETGALGTASTDNKISVFRGTENEAIAILSDMTADSEGTPLMFRAPNDYSASSRTPTTFENYFLPAQQCTIKVYVTMTANAAATGGYQANLTMYAPDASNYPATAGTDNPYDSNTLLPGDTAFYGIGFTTVAPVGATPRKWYVTVDPNTFASETGYDVFGLYIDVRDPTNLRQGNAGVMVRTFDPTFPNLTAGSIVSPNKVYVVGNMNTNSTAQPFNVLSPDVRFGVSAAPASVGLTGQRGTLNTTLSNSVDTVTDYSGATVASKTVSLSDVTNPNLVPPVTIRGWMILVNPR